MRVTGHAKPHDSNQRVSGIPGAVHSWAHTQVEKGAGDYPGLIKKYRVTTTPPWIVLRQYIEQMRESSGDPELFNFEFSDPETDILAFHDHSQYSFQTVLTNKTTGDSYSTGSLSSGEKILMALCLTSFNQSAGCKQPKLALFDELDCVLHPSMISALISGLKTLFVDNGISVIIATHSVTTAAMVEEGEIFRIIRKNKRLSFKPASQSEAVSELSEGIATVDIGLKIAFSKKAPITILSEGNNVLHLKKWASLFYPNDIIVFDGLRDKTNDSQLKTYGQLLAKMKTNSHVLIVWDCDAQKHWQGIIQSLKDVTHITPFIFKTRENKFAKEGIENNYNEDVLEPFSTRTTNYLAHEEIINCSFQKNKKTPFAEFIFSNGTKEHFQHFGALNQTVEEILNRL